MSNAIEQLQEYQDHPSKGLSLWKTIVFIFGELAGTGVLALPKALENTGLIGILLLLLFGFVTGYTARLLGTCWCIVRDRYPEYRGHVRYPFPALGEISYGRTGRYLVTACIHTNNYGGTVALLLLASENMSLILKHFEIHLSVCTWVLIIGAILTPFTWLGTPKDFWGVALSAVASTTIGCIILIVCMAIDSGERPKVNHSPATFRSLSVGFGIFSFAFGGHMVFLTFQNDMTDQTQFGKAAAIGFTLSLMVYIPVSVTGYVIYGKDIDANILKTVTNSSLLAGVQVLVTLHTFCVALILLNPISQEVEELLQIPNQFSWKRCIVRSVLMGLVVFGAETIPSFGNILPVIGGSTFAALAYFFPPLIYLKLTRMKGPWEEILVPLHKTVFLYEIIVVGVIVAVAATTSAITNIVEPGSLTLPCYLK